MTGVSGAETSAAQLQAAARADSGLTKGEPYIKPYDYFSFGSDAREVSGNYSPAPCAERHRASRGGGVRPAR